MPSRNHTVIETEKKFRCTNIDKLIAHAVSLGFNQIQENGQEHDIYFTDKEQLFITQRICLRIRQTENQCEITYKGDSHDTEALYSKLETNIKISYDNKGHAITLLESL
jgi:predicted adenylyl cyclase CyaB